MISFKRILAVVIRHLLVVKQDPNVLLFGLYWPILDVLIMGFLGTWIQKTSPHDFHNYSVVALLGILLWQVVGRGCNTIISTLNEELWARNVVNLFSLPLRL